MISEYRTVLWGGLKGRVQKNKMIRKYCNSKFIFGVSIHSPRPQPQMCEQIKHTKIMHWAKLCGQSGAFENNRCMIFTNEGGILC